jgi:hypothetical protein
MPLIDERTLRIEEALQFLKGPNCKMKKGAISQDFEESPPVLGIIKRRKISVMPRSA